MTTDRSTTPTLSPPLAVQLTSWPIYGESAFSVFVELRERLGDDQVCLFESLGGPVADTSRAMIGISPLLDVTIRDGSIALTGAPALVEWAASRLGELDTLEATAAATFTLVAKGDVWSALRYLQAGFDAPDVSDDSFGFGFVTVFSYDAVQYMEKLPELIERVDPDPDMVFRIYAATIDVALPADKGLLTVASSERWDGLDAASIVELAASAPHIDTTDDAHIPSVAPEHSGAFTMTPAEYVEKAKLALAHIHAGDIYQVQLGHPITVTAERRDLDVYRRLRAINPSPYMAFLPLGELAVISGSPELHVRVDARELTMRPIAGTARKTADAAKNAENVAWLKQDAKEAAEHIMLVDLCRNDLGRVAVPGTVAVTSLMQVEEYSHVFHLVSTVVATKEDRADAYDVIIATFPAGTVTGAPKIRAMEIIESMEKSRRGIYAGVFGVIGFGGFVNLALSLRTIVATPSGYTARASAGVVVDSDPDSEWLETLAKMGSTIRAITNGDPA
ncbi:MAG TPA: anthranilate synthase component I family protein [Galbitalea sp.]|jgi:anthranilate synthase component 1|nr:anthranilate synthase component I family protein [Galbitalea sp.]